MKYMELLIYVADGDPAPWLAGFAEQLPHARLRTWAPGERADADYAIVWKPPKEMLAARQGWRAIFNLGAGVDALLELERETPGLLPPDLALIRLDDAGMASQMAEYVAHAVLRYLRRFDDYAAQQARREWRVLEPHPRASFQIGVLGLGELGAHVAQTLACLGLPVRGWSRSAKQLPGVASFCGTEQFDAFLDGVRVLVNLLPNTPHTRGILNRETFAKLGTPAYLINVARGAHLVEADLLAALAQHQIAGATLDVFNAEPLPHDHPFWNDPRITITPHISALTLRAESIKQIAAKIAALEQGAAVKGMVEVTRGY
jgi:glyoxylate/hydroxypyruvate reductase